MRGLVWDGKRLRFIPDIPQPEASADGAVVRVHAAGICSTDLQIQKGYMGFRGVLGHEFVGEVLQGPSSWMGQRVVGEINFACGRCPSCRSGHRRHCPSRTVLGIQGADGAFADQVRIPIENLHRVPGEMLDRHAAFVEPLAAAFEAESQTRHLSGAETTILGAGKLGLLVAQVLASRGDEVRVVCRGARARRRVQELGLRPSEIATTPRGQDLVIEATGAVEGLGLAMELVRPLGTIVAKSTVAATHSIDLAPLVIHEISLIGSRCGPFEPALKALQSGAIAVDPLLDDVYPIEKGVEAMAAAAQPGALKVLLEINP